MENKQNDNTKMYEAVKKIKQPEKTEGKTVWPPAQQSKVRLLQNILKRRSIKTNSQEQSYHRHEWRYCSQLMVSAKQ